MPASQVSSLIALPQPGDCVRRGGLRGVVRCLHGASATVDFLDDMGWQASDYLYRSSKRGNLGQLFRVFMKVDDHHIFYYFIVSRC